MTDERFRRMISRQRYAQAVAATVSRCYEIGQRIANDPPAHLTDPEKGVWFTAMQKYSDAINDEFGYEGDQR